MEVRNVHPDPAALREVRDTNIAPRGANATMLVLGVLLFAAAWLFSVYPAGDVGDRFTRNTIRLSFAWYVAALGGMTRLKPGDWAAATTAGRAVRWCWTWAAVVFVVHVAAAFHFFHHWSHRHAFEETLRESGVGEGIYVSYLFTAAWAADAAWWWFAPRRYADRSKWVDRALHSFMAFIVFNGTVVYESGMIRVAGIVGFGLVSILWIMSRKWSGTRDRSV